MINTPLEHQHIQVNGINLHVVCAGKEDGIPLILLHGFPEFWYSWRHQIDALTGAGFRLWIPDQRGYNLSDRPADAAQYGLDTLADDVIGLIDHIGVEKANLVGHDWGGAAAWWTANKFPERVAKLATMNIPHHTAFSRAVREDPEQRRKVMYMAFFRLPLLPEWMIRFNDGQLLARWAFGKDHPAFPVEVMSKYREAWSQPGAGRGMFNWYRGISKARPSRLEDPRIAVPTMLIWGKRDKVFKAELAQKSIDLCDDGQLHMIDHATHWVQHEAAEEVNELLIDWFRS